MSYGNHFRHHLVEGIRSPHSLRQVPANDLVISWSNYHSDLYSSNSSPRLDLPTLR